MDQNELQSKDRAFLRREAHRLHPLVMVGAKGLTPAIGAALAESLGAHELVKVKFQDFTEEKEQICSTLATETGSVLVGITGNIGLFYKQAPDPEKRFIVLPGSKST